MRERPDADFHEAALFGAISERLADRFGTRGLPITLSTACASGATAIQLGVEAIRQGRTTRALSIATDGSLSAEALIRFSLLSALSTQNDPPTKASKPFSKDRDGFVIAEGAATLVLESLEAAIARGAKVLGIMNGCGDKGRQLPPHPLVAGRWRRRSRRSARRWPTPAWTRTISATSTPTAPRRRKTTRWNICRMSTVFGERLASIPISSNKSMIGHTLTAAGAVEAVFSLQTMRDRHAAADHQL